MVPSNQDIRKISSYTIQEGQRVRIFLKAIFIISSWSHLSWTFLLASQRWSTDVVQDKLEDETLTIKENHSCEIWSWICTQRFWKSWDWWLTCDKANVELGIWASSLSYWLSGCITKPFSLSGYHIEGLYQIKLFSNTRSWGSPRILN